MQRAFTFDDPVIDGHKYPIAVDYPNEKPGPAWWDEGTVTDQEESPTTFGPGKPIDQVITCQWIMGRQRGNGRSFASRRDRLGVHYSVGWDDSLDNYLRLIPAKYSLTPTNATADVPTYFFEESISGTLNYYCQQRHTYRMTVDSGTGAITSVNETDQGASAVAGPPAKFLGLWYIPLGASVDFTELTTPSSNTFTAASGSMRALAFATTMDALTPKLARAHSTNQVALCPTAPRTAATWGGNFSVGDSTGTITALAESGIRLFVGKTDSLYDFLPTTGATQNLLNIGGGKGQSTNGLGTIAIPSTEIAAYNHDSGFHVVAGQDMLMNRFLDGMPTMTDVAGLTLEPYRGDVYELAAVGNWVYMIYRIVSGGNTRSWVFQADWRSLFGAPDSFEWHCVAVEDSWIRGLRVSSDKKLWYATNGTIAYRQLGADGSPDAGPVDSKGRGNASTTFSIVLQETDAGLPFTAKQIREGRVYTDGAATAAPLQLQVMRDGGSAENVGTTITSDGTNNVTSRFLTSGTNDQATRVQPILTTTTTSGYSPTATDLRVHGLEIDMMPLPKKAALIRMLIDTRKPFYADGSPVVEDPKTIRDNLRALRAAADVACTDPDGNQVRLHILDVMDREVVEAGEAMAYVLEVVARERRTA